MSPQASGRQRHCFSDVSWNLAPRQWLRPGNGGMEAHDSLDVTKQVSIDDQIFPFAGPWRGFVIRLSPRIDNKLHE